MKKIKEFWDLLRLKRKWKKFLSKKVHLIYSNFNSYYIDFLIIYFEGNIDELKEKTLEEISKIVTNIEN
jgi:hypothetical protein